MKKSIKERLIILLKSDISKFNRYIKFSLSVDFRFKCNLEFANLKFANLEFANLESANLKFANLEFANLKSANLKSANLESANLKSANLEFANLESANLKFANLEFANLDRSCLPLWCGSLKFKSDLRIRTQIGFHFASLIANCDNATAEEKEIFAKMLDYVNRFHRNDVEKLEKL